MRRPSCCRHRSSTCAKNLRRAPAGTCGGHIDRVAVVGQRQPAGSAGPVRTSTGKETLVVAVLDQPVELGQRRFQRGAGKCVPISAKRTRLGR